jgi:hypothetical protein
MINTSFLSVQKDTAYYIGYWVTALLPVILGFGLTMIMVWYFTKSYKGPEEEEEKDKDKK